MFSIFPSRIVRIALTVFIPLFLLSLIALGVQASAEPAPTAGSAGQLDHLIHLALGLPAHALSNRPAAADWQSGAALPRYGPLPVSGVESMMLAAPPHTLPEGITVYDPDTQPASCSGTISPSTASLSYEEEESWENGTSKTIVVCSQGASVHLSLFAGAVGEGAGVGAVLVHCDDDQCYSYHNEVEGKHVKRWYVYNDCHHNEAFFEGNVYLPPGKYIMYTYTAFSTCSACGGRDPWWRMFMDITSPRPNTDRTLAPESTCLANNPTAPDNQANTLSGNASIQQTDVTLPELGLPLNFERSYNSLDLEDGPMGRGWTHSYNMSVITEPIGYSNTVTLVAPRGSRLRFDQQTDGSFKPEPGINASLSLSVTGAYTTYIITQSNQIVYTFDTAGHLKTVADPNGHSTELGYTNGKLTSITGAGGRELTLEYNNWGLLTQINAPPNRTIDLTYTAHISTDNPGIPHVWLLDNVTGMDDNQTDYTYDIDGYLETIADPTTVTKTFYYDLRGRVVSQTTALEPPRYFDYGYGPTVVTGTNGHTTTYGYNDLGLLAVVTDALGNATGYERDDNYNPTLITDARDNSTAVEWSGCGCRPTSVTDAMENTTTMEYDALNNLTRVEDAREAVTTYFYSGALLTKTVDAMGNATVYTYSTGGAGQPPYGLLMAQKDAEGRITRYWYNEFGQRTIITDAAGLVTRYGYDAAGRLITTTAPGPSTGSGQALVTVNDYDNADRLTRVTRNYTTTSSAQNYLNEYNLATEYDYDDAGRQTAVTDTLGHVTRNWYDDAGRLISTTVNYTTTSSQQNYLNQYNIITRYGYDDTGKQILVTDTLTHTTRTFYNPLGQTTVVTTNYVLGGPFDAQTNLTRTTGYDPVGNVVTQTDTLGRKTVTEYDPLNRPVTVTTNYVSGEYDPDYPDQDLAMVTAYDETGNATARRDAANHWSYYEYDKLGQLITTTNALPARTVTHYNKAGQRSGTQDAKGKWTRYGYDDAGRLVAVTVNYENGVYSSSSPDEDISTVTVYDDFGRCIKTIEAYGTPVSRTTVYTYSPTGRLVKMQDAGGSLTQYAYDALGRTIAVTDTLGQATYTQYDALGRAVTVTVSCEDSVYSDACPEQGITTVSQYNALGWLLKRQDARGNWTTFEYDDLGRAITTTNAVGVSTVTIYNRAGERTQSLICGAEGNCLTQASFEYDDVGRLIEQTDALSHATRYAYDPIGSRTLMTDANNIVTRYEYDALSRLITVTENYTSGPPTTDHNVMTSYGYDAIGNRIQITNAKSQISNFTYDDLSRLIEQSDPLTHTTRYGYDPLGNRVVLTDANNEVTRYTYDIAGRLRVISYTADVTAVRYDYDAMGNRTAMTDGTGATAYDYDGFYRPLTITSPYTGAVGYGYDENGNRTQLIYPDHKTVTYVYDAANRLTGITDWDESTTYNYDTYGRLATITLPNDVQTIYTYDNANRVTHLLHTRTDDNVVLAEYSFAFDNVGNRTVVTEAVRLPAGSGGGGTGLGAACQRRRGAGTGHRPPPGGAGCAGAAQGCSCGVIYHYLPLDQHGRFDQHGLVGECADEHSPIGIQHHFPGRACARYSGGSPSAQPRPQPADVFHARRNLRRSAFGRGMPRPHSRGMPCPRVEVGPDPHKLWLRKQHPASTGSQPGYLHQLY